jgi:hypothetical protein
MIYFKASFDKLHNITFTRKEIGKTYMLMLIEPSDGFENKGSHIKFNPDKIYWHMNENTPQITEETVEKFFRVRKPEILESIKTLSANSEIMMRYMRTAWSRSLSPINAVKDIFQETEIPDGVKIDKVNDTLVIKVMEAIRDDKPERIKEEIPDAEVRKAVSQKLHPRVKGLMKSIMDGDMVRYNERRTGQMVELLQNMIDKKKSQLNEENNQSS